MLKTRKENKTARLRKMGRERGGGGGERRGRVKKWGRTTVLKKTRHQILGRRVTGREGGEGEK